LKKKLNYKMDNFNNIIKQKAELFEVPFNDAHWVEMEARLNNIQSKKKKTLFLGSAAAIITISLSTFFLFSTNKNIDLNSSEQVPAQKTSELTKTNIEQKTLSKTETIKDVIITEENLTEMNPIEVIRPAEKKASSVQKIVEKELKSNPPVVIVEKHETTTKKQISSVKQSITKTNLDIKNSEKSLIEEKTLENSSQKTAVSTSELKAVQKTAPKPASTDKIKGIRHKVYEDENVSKKSIKRRRRGILSFISFKKKIYKVPLARKKSSKRKKK